MANYAINVTDATNDTWTVSLLLAPTLASGGSAQANGATTAGALATALMKAVEALKNHVSTNGHN
jgi:hypothetical protein